MIDNYLAQSITWEHVIDTDAYSEATYQKTMILGRLEAGHKLVRDRFGAEVISTACLFTKADVQPEDLINGRLVVSVDPETFLDGSLGWNEVYLL